MRITRVCTAVLLCAVGVLPTQGAEVGSYDLEQLKAIARSTHPTLESVQATIEQAEAIRHNGQRLADPELHISFGRADSGPVSGSEESFELTQEIELSGFRKWRRQAVITSC